MPRIYFVAAVYVHDDVPESQPLRQVGRRLAVQVRGQDCQRSFMTSDRSAYA